MLLQVFENLVTGVIGFCAIVMRVFTQRHFLDKTDIDTTIDYKTDQVEHFVVVVVFQYNAIDLDLIEITGDRRVDAIQCTA
ncbi:hypothetical protein MnTg03_00248 [bacterium MnTg03]|nr:hypothetical protein MnTg03_00248 [bacterium MnTg03]